MLLFHHVIGPAVHFPPALSIQVVLMTKVPNMGIPGKLIAASSEVFFDQHHKSHQKNNRLSEL